MNNLTKPKPKDIHHVVSDFPNEYHKFVKFFYSQSTDKNVQYAFKILMIMSDVKMQQQMSNFLHDYNLYMNSNSIDDTTKVMAGWIKNAKPSLFF